MCAIILYSKCVSNLQKKNKDRIKKEKIFLIFFSHFKRLSIIYIKKQRQNKRRIKNLLLNFLSVVYTKETKTK